MASAGNRLVADQGGARLSRRDFIIAGGLATAALVPALVSPAPQGSALGRGGSLAGLVPERIGPWIDQPASSIVIPKGEDSDDTYEDVVTRYYVSDRQAPVMLLLAFGSAQAGNAQLHRPEVCYPAAGFDLRDSQRIQLPLAGQEVGARFVTASAPGRIEQILYWTRIGRDFPTSSLGQRWSILRHTLDGTLPDGMLVRISTIDPDRGRGLNTVRQFASSLLRGGGPDLRLLLVGRS